MSEIWNALLVNPIFNILLALFKVTGSLGASIILLTLIIRTVLLPIILPSLKSAKKQKELMPELQKIRKKYKYDKKKQAELQMELYKKHGINPATGCISQLPMLFILIAVFNVIRKFSTGITTAEINEILYVDAIRLPADFIISTDFLNIQLTEPFLLMGILAGFFQLLVSMMMRDRVALGEKLAEKTPEKTDDIAYNMQEQMLYLMPLMTTIISINLPAGTVLYILTTTIFSVVQQYFITGWGSLAPYLEKVGLLSKESVKALDVQAESVKSKSVTEKKSNDSKKEKSTSKKKSKKKKKSSKKSKE